MAGAWVAGLLAAGCAVSQGADPVEPSKPKKEVSVIAAPTAMIEAALADAANRSTVAPDGIKVVSATAVTWPDGSLGCPKPGMLYAQALVPGFQILLRAGDQILNYHAAARGQPVFCPSSRVVAPVPASADPAI
jgi:hypothetical protein